MPPIKVDPSKRYVVTIRRIGRDGVEVFVTSPATGLMLWNSPRLRWPLTPLGEAEFRDVGRHCPGATPGWLKSEVSRALRVRSS